jgi:membrane protein YqaA with SNARE-associated domain
LSFDFLQAAQAVPFSFGLWNGFLDLAAAPPVLLLFLCCFFSAFIVGADPEVLFWPSAVLLLAGDALL